MPEDEFEIYLTLLAKTLRLKDDQRDAIAAELRDHMEARLHELTLKGVEREDAIETALAEFGDASGLAKDLTRTNPQRTRTRRHFMQTTFGTIATCAAVTFAVMLLVPYNKDGQPNQPFAAAQDGFDGGPSGLDGGGGFGEEGGNDAFASPDGALLFEQARLELSIKVVDCTEILRPDHNRGDLLERTASLAVAVQNTVASVNKHGHRAIQVQPFEEFLIITATEPAYKEAGRLLEQISDRVAVRSAKEEQKAARWAEQERDRREQLIRTEARYQEIQRQRIGLSQALEEYQLEYNHMIGQFGEVGEDHPKAQQMAKQIKTLKGEIKAVEKQLQLMRVELEMQQIDSRHPVGDAPGGLGF